jgi:hypothetical protein
MAVMPGDKYVYTHTEGKGYGEHNKAEAGFGELSAEMTELDLKDGTEVSFLDYDAESLWPVVQWVDATGTERITTIDPDIFVTNFIPR